VTVRRWVLWTDGVVLGLLLVFVSNLALVLPIRPFAEYWGLAWPLFVGDTEIRIPDLVVYASFIAVAVCFGILLVAAAIFAARRINACSFRKAREIN
jgi:hypothetical protein